ncbi:hypothetical protein, variant [Aphanomyces astaci]|nr:hypothetical protein, variant [Aphanomyces astaci]ETV86601.1 hypothetical protein, variant [Aphanomyces astaci]|eukprot:XP_009823400.1 hypothetical protein, variant [Aphanomyces astaci]
MQMILALLQTLLLCSLVHGTASASTCISALDGQVLDLRNSAHLVNDDYCDCVDGVDEPSTSACSHLPASMFHCRNEGILSLSVHTSRVHDGVCDCCDGTDERLGRCANTCHVEIGKRRERAMKDLVVLETGMMERKRRVRVLEAEDEKKAADLITHAAVQRELRQLKQKVQVFLDREARREFELQVASAKLKETVQNGKCLPSDRHLHVTDTPPNEDNVVPQASTTSTTTQASSSTEHQVASEFKQAQVKRILGHAVVYRQHGNWMSLSAYMHDVVETTKRMPVRTVSERRKQDFLGPFFHGGREGQVVVLTALLRGLGLVLSPVRLLVEGAWWLQYYWSHLLHCVLPSSVLSLWQTIVDAVELDWRYQKSLTLRRMSQGRVFWWYWYISSGAEVVWDAPVVTYKYLFPTLDMTVVLPEAKSLRKIIADIDHDLARTQLDMDALNQVDAVDYGDCCRILKGTCVMAQIEKYVYKVCPFEAVHQDKTLLGSWKRWQPQPNANEPLTMVFEDGERCWNGPSR